MNIKDEIEKYKPSCEQEVVDKELILDCLNKFENVFTRDNKLIHMTVSALLINKDKNKVLMEFHKIYNSWGWVGGHADGDKNLLNVIKKEIKEETGVGKLKLISDGIFSLEVLAVLSHFRRGKYVSAHTHISIDYLFEVDENEKVRPKEDENSEVSWIPINKMVEFSTEPHMKVVYQKLIDKIKFLV